MSVLRFLKLGFLGQRIAEVIQSLGEKFDDLLSSEETAGNDNVFYNPQDLTSLRVGRDGTGGQPVVGDPVGIMLDTSGLSGSMDEFLGGQPELLTNADFSSGTTGWTIVSATASPITNGVQITATATYGRALQIISTEIGKLYLVSATSEFVSGADASYMAKSDDGGSVNQVISAGGANAASGDKNFVFVATATETYINPGVRDSGSVINFTGISVKEIPGNHAIAPTDAARPVLMDDPDTTWASLTDDGTRGEAINSVTSYGSSGGTESGLPFEQGSDYEVTFTVEGRTVGTMKPQFTGGVAQIGTPVSANGTYTETLTATNNANFQMVAGGGFDGTVSGISVRKVNTAFDERGGELVVSPDFSDAGQWSLDAGWSITGGVLVGAAPGSFSNANPTKTEATAADDALQITVTIDSCDDFLEAGLLYGPTVRNFQALGVTAPGTYTFNVIAGTSSTRLYVRSANITVSQFSVKRILTPNLLLGYNTDDDSTFDTDTGNWGKDPGVSIGSGVATFNTAGFGDLYYSNLLTIDKWYKVTFYVSRYVSGNIRLNAQRDDTGLAPIITPAVGWHTLYGRAVSTLFKIGSAVASDYDIDNVIVQELPTTTPTSYYLDTDGVDDWMEVTPTLNLGEQWWHTGAWQADASGDWAFASSSVLYGGVRSSSVWNWYDSAAGLSPITTSNPATKHVLTIEQSDTNGLSARYNGATEVDPITPYDDSASAQGLALFSRQNTTFANGLDGRFYGGAWGQGQVDYDELTTLQDYLGTLVEPDIDPTDVTSYANVYEMLSAQTAAALFDIDDTTSLRVGRDGSGGVPVDGDPVGMMMDVSGAGGGTMAAHLAGQTNLVSATADTVEPGWSESGGVLTASSPPTSSEAGWTGLSIVEGAWYEITFDAAVTSGAVLFRLYQDGEYATETVVASGSYSFVIQSGSAGVGTAFVNALVFVPAGSFTGTVSNVTLKELPGYVATAPSDAARPTLASVLDETASELTDDGTRGAELVTNGTFDTDIDGWSNLNATRATITWNDGKARIDNTTGTGDGYILSPTLSPLEIGSVYKVTANVTAVTGTAVASKVYAENGARYLGAFTVTGGVLAFDYVPQATSGYFMFANSDAFNIWEIDNVSVKKVQTVFDGRGDELVTNGDFSDGTTGWTPSSATLSIVSGRLQVVATSGYGGFNQIISANPNTFIEYSFDIAAGSGEIVAQVYDESYGTLLHNYFITAGTSATQTISFSTQGFSSIRILIRSVTASTFTVGSFSMREVLTPNLLLTSAGDDDSTFDTATGNWTLGAGWSITGGELVASAAAAINADYAGVLTVGRWYKAMVYVAAYTGGTFSIGSYGQAGLTTQSGTGWKEQYFLASHSTLAIRAIASLTADLDNVIVQEVPASVARAFYLDFDGLDDNLILDGTDFGSSTNATLYKTFRGDTADTQQIMFGTNSGPYVLAATNTTDTLLSSSVGSPVYREDGVIPAYSTRGDLFTALIDNTDHTIGTEEVDLTAHVNWTTDGFYIGGEYSVGFDSTGRLYAWAAVDTRLDGRNRDLLENFMISRKTS